MKKEITLSFGVISFPFCGQRDRLLRQDLLELGKAGQTVHLLHLGLALDEGQGIVDEGLLDAVALGVDPLLGELLLGVGHIGEVEELGAADILAVLLAAPRYTNIVYLGP